MDARFAAATMFSPSDVPACSHQASPFQNSRERCACRSQIRILADADISGDLQACNPGITQ